jgi:hypothetical protein
MTSYTLQVQPRRQYSIQYSNERGPQGPAGSNATATTDASLLVSGTLSDARLSSNVALENVANVFTAKQSFSGTTHSGLCLNSLTTTEYNALTAANGDLFRDSTTDRIDARLNRGTVELIDTAGGQTINGALTTTGQITAPLGSAATPGIVFSGSNSGIYGLSGPLGIMLTSNGGAGMLLRGDNAQVVLPISWGYGWSSTANPASSQDTRLSRNAAGVVQIGTTANNASGSLLLTNINASGIGTFDTIDLTVSGSVRGRWSGNGGIAMGNARGIGWAHESTGTAGIGTAFYLVSNGLVQLGTLGANSNASLNLTNITASGTVNGRNIRLTTGDTVSPGSHSIWNGGGNTMTFNGGTSGYVFNNDANSLNLWTIGNTGNGVLAGSLRIGGGTVVANILSATATLDFPSIAANSFADLTITVTGAVSGDTVIANPIAGSAITDVSYDAWVSAANTVTIRATNNSSTTARDPASGTFRATVIRF